MNLLILLLIAFAIVIPIAQAVDVTVNPGGSIQSAVNSAPGNGANKYVIHVKAGTYKEVVHIPKGKNHISITGDGKDKTIITNHLYAGLNNMGTFSTATLFVEANDFTAENIGIVNSAGDNETIRNGNGAQALALRVDADRVIFKDCNLIGWQDTVLVNTGHHYFKSCYISGSVDFIFGGATSYFDSCTLHSRHRSNTDMVTAASTPQEQAHGMVFNHCIFSADANTKFLLGRPWRPYAAVTIINSNLSAAVEAVGWSHWKVDSDVANARYYEYGNTGAGASTSGRKFSHVLSKTQADALTPHSVLGFDV